jgi:hypothetical protein
MRLYSTPKSIKAGEITALAILETIIAASIAIYIASRRNSLMHIAIAASIAPFLLLRTIHSVNLVATWTGFANKYFNMIFESLYRDGKRSGGLFLPSIIFPIITPLILLSIFIIKIGALIFVLFRHPIDMIVEIPRNWFRLTFCTDIVHPAQIIPDFEGVLDKLWGGPI